MMQSRAAGFTLIEVLVAMAIVAVTLAAGMRAASALTDNAARLADVVAAQWCADNQLTKLRRRRLRLRAARPQLRRQAADAGDAEPEFPPRRSGGQR
jgi:type II secretion system protein I